MVLLEHSQTNTRSAFPLQELWVKFTGWGCWSVSLLHGPPLKSTLQELLRGLTMSMLHCRYFDQPRKTPGWGLRITRRSLTKPRAGCHMEPRRRGALAQQTRLLLQFMASTTMVETVTQGLCNNQNSWNRRGVQPRGGDTTIERAKWEEQFL